MVAIGAVVALLASQPVDTQRPTALRVVSGVIPAYPSVAAQARISGRFRVRVKVNVTGTPVCADLVDPLMPLMKPVTEEAALAWRFEPASVEEMKAEPYRQVELTFLARLPRV